MRKDYGVEFEIETAVSESPTTKQPQAFLLQQSYPNPFSTLFFGSHLIDFDFPTVVESRCRPYSTSSLDTTAKGCNDHGK